MFSNRILQRRLTLSSIFSMWENSTLSKHVKNFDGKNSSGQKYFLKVTWKLHFRVQTYSKIQKWSQVTTLFLVIKHCYILFWCLQAYWRWMITVQHRCIYYCQKIRSESDCFDYSTHAGKRTLFILNYALRPSVSSSSSTNTLSIGWVCCCLLSWDATSITHGLARHMFGLISQPQRRQIQIWT